MKFKFFPFAYYSFLAIHVILFIWAVVVSIHAGTIEEGLFLFGLFEIFFLPCTPLACQTVKIDKDGIEKRFWLITFKKIYWKDIYRIQIHTNYDITVPYKFIYFLLKPFDNESLQWIQSKDKKYIVMARYSDKLINCIKSYTDKEIEEE